MLSHAGGQRRVAQCERAGLVEVRGHRSFFSSAASANSRARSTSANQCVARRRERTVRGRPAGGSARSPAQCPPAAAGMPAAACTRAAAAMISQAVASTVVTRAKSRMQKRVSGVSGRAELQRHLVGGAEEQRAMRADHGEWPHGVRGSHSACAVGQTRRRPGVAALGRPPKPVAPGQFDRQQHHGQRRADRQGERHAAEEQGARNHNGDAEGGEGGAVAAAGRPGGGDQPQHRLVDHATAAHQQDRRQDRHGDPGDPGPCHQHQDERRNGRARSPPAAGSPSSARPRQHGDEVLIGNAATPRKGCRRSPVPPGCGSRRSAGRGRCRPSPPPPPHSGRPEAPARRRRAGPAARWPAAMPGKAAPDRSGGLPSAGLRLQRGERVPQRAGAEQRREQVVGRGAGDQRDQHRGPAAEPGAQEQGGQCHGHHQQQGRLQLGPPRQAGILPVGPSTGPSCDQSRAGRCRSPSPA